MTFFLVIYACVAPVVIGYLCFQKGYKLGIDGRVEVRWVEPEPMLDPVTPSRQRMERMLEEVPTNAQENE